MASSRARNGATSPFHHAAKRGSNRSILLRCTLVANGTKRTSPSIRAMSAFGGKADITAEGRKRRFDPTATSAGPADGCVPAEVFAPESRRAAQPQAAPQKPQT